MPSDPAPSGAVPARTIFDSAKDDDRNRRLLNLIVSPTGIRECRLVSVAGDEGLNCRRTDFWPGESPIRVA